MNEVNETIEYTPVELLVFGLGLRNVNQAKTEINQHSDQYLLHGEVVPHFGITLQSLAETITSLGLHWSIPLFGQIVSGGDFLKYWLNFDDESDITIQVTDKKLAQGKEVINNLLLQPAHED
ncbi:hypothetical protein KBC89_05375 [Candidatus Woesebacteria bacterium]|nr:hypothetical protein [Candidatus Woesebacteria bacterium]